MPWRPRFAVDADFNETILRGWKRRGYLDPIVRVHDVGLGSAPDPEVLEWAAGADLIVLTHDVNTMPGFASQRLEKGLPLPGLVLVPQGLPIGAVIEDLDLLARVGQRSDFQDRIDFLPL